MRLTPIAYALVFAALFSAPTFAQVGGNGVNKATSTLGNPQLIGPGNVLDPQACSGGPQGTNVIRGFLVQQAANGTYVYTPVC